MNSIVKAFDYNESQVRTVIIDGAPWFVAQDVCNILEVGNTSQALSRLDEDEKRTIILNDGKGGNPNTSIVSESGLYSLVLGSRKSQAKPFKRWVTHDVLPSIRKTGSYTIAPQHELPQTYLEALKCLVASEEQKALLAAKIEKDAPLVEYAEAVQGSETDIDFNAFAKMMGTGRTRLFRALREMGVIMQNSTLPYQKWFDADYFEACQEISADGKLRPYAVITGKGQIWLRQKLNHFWSKNTQSELSLFDIA